MEHRAPTPSGRRAALGDLALRRALARANTPEWRDDLLRAGTAVHGLVGELRFRMRTRGLTAGSARELLDAGSIATADRMVAALRADATAAEARWGLVRAIPGWRDRYARACALGASVGALSADELEALGDFLRSLAESVRGWALVMLAGAGEGSRRPRDVAAVGVAAWCDAHGVGLLGMAEAAYRLGIEHVDEKKVERGSDPKQLIADRWRKAAAAARRKK